MMLKATKRQPSGFSDVNAHEEAVTIIGFVWGKSQDVGRYSDHREECAIAIILDAAGRLSPCPISNLSVTP